MSPVPDEVRVGVAHFNLGEYFEAHEAWEDHWGKGPREERELTLGLIKAAVALHHLEARNAAGFFWQAKEAVPRLRAHGALWPDLKLEELAETLESLAAQARFRGEVPAEWERPLLPLD
jgi:predicted metal-dependent hydrolase